MNRKNFLHTTLTGLGSIAGYAIAPGSYPGSSTEQLKQELVKEFVGAGHGNLDRVKELLSEFPNLLFSSYDWGNGDFEEAIEGAGHVGDYEIAEYLITQGARVNLFVLTMMGQTHLVKPVLEKYPELLQAKGAHGFTLLHHAKAGGSRSEELHAYLQEKGLDVTQISIK